MRLLAAPMLARCEQDVWVSRLIKWREPQTLVQSIPPKFARWARTLTASDIRDGAPNERAPDPSHDVDWPHDLEAVRMR
jgi:hypothetical protein